MIRKLIVTVLLLVGAGSVVGPVSPALAGGGPIDYADCVLTVDPSTFEAGAIVTVVGTGFQPSFETTIEFGSDLVGSVTTDAIGGFTTDVTIPADAPPGPNTITAVCDVAVNLVTTSVIVSSNSVTSTTLGGDRLPRTGSEVEPLVIVGAVALLAGVSFVLVAMRRRRSVA